MLPWRARPVPFCLYGFLLPPDTSLRVFVEALPWRRFTSCAVTTWWRTATLGVIPNTCSLSSSSSMASPAMLYTVVEGIAVTSSMLPDDEQATIGTRHRAFDQEQITLTISLNYLQSLRCHTHMAHMTGHARPFEDTTRSGAGPNRSRGACAVRLAMGLRPSTETMTFDSALEAFSFGGTDNVHRLANLEQARVKFRAKR